MNDPRRWTASELARDVEQAKAEFRRRRLHEPLDVYSRFFRTFAPIFADVIDRLPALIRNPCDPAVVGELVRDGDVRTAFRYLAAPPVSEDDLKTLAETNLSAATLRSDAEQAQRVRDVVLQIVDPHRFPWISENRNPTEHERMRAVIASAVLVAARKVETSRRSDAKRLTAADSSPQARHAEDHLFAIARPATSILTITFRCTDASEPWTGVGGVTAALY